MNRRGITLIEILAVIVIATVLILLTVPAMRSLTRTESSSAAEGQLQAGILQARDAALRSSEGRDTAAFFSFEPGGRMTITACVQVGSIDDEQASELDPNLRPIRRDVFIPIDGLDPVQLSGSWMVRGYAAPGMIRGDWYNRPSTSGVTQRYDANEGAWVFPETGFYDASRADDGDNRQSFIIRFEGGTGVVRSSSIDEALVLSVRPSSVDRRTDLRELWLNPDGFRGNNASPQPPTSLVRWATRVLTARDLNGDGAIENALSPAGADTVIRRQVIGGQSSDMVLVRPVQQVVLYDELALAASLGVRVDPISKSLYWVDPNRLRPGSGQARQLFPALVPWQGDPPNGPPAADQRDMSRRINRWIEGSDLSRGERLVRIAPNRIYMVDRFSATLRAVQPPPLARIGDQVPRVTQ
ncbi:MAG: Tfp pilus assembly protein FimT/FimU [Phycisphaerales bacterium]